MIYSFLPGKGGYKPLTSKHMFLIYPNADYNMPSTKLMGFGEGLEWLLAELYV